MVFKTLKRLLGSGSSAQSSEEAVIYNGFTIKPCPSSRGSGYSTEAQIEKEIDGEVKSHHFIRADTASSKDEAVRLVISKAQVMIDQQGERIFK